MHLLIIVLLICGAVCFLLAALNAPFLASNPPASPWHPRVIGLGLFFWILSTLIPVLSRVGVFILAALILSACSSCSTTTPDPAKNERNAGINAAGSAALKDAGKVLGSVITSTLFSLAQSEIGGSQTKADLGSAAASAVWSQVNTGQVDIGAGISHSITAFSDGKLRQTAIEAQKAANDAIAHGRSDADVQNAVATVISTAAGAPPAR